MQKNKKKKEKKSLETPPALAPALFGSSGSSVIFFNFFRSFDPPRVTFGGNPRRVLTRRGNHWHLYGGFGSIALFFTAWPRVVILTALQTASAFVGAHEYRAVCTVQAAQPL